MTRIKMWCVACVVGWLMSAGVGWTADASLTATELGKLHHSNQKEIALGRLAQANGTSRKIRSFGQILVKDDATADRKVVMLAAREKIDLARNTAPMNQADIASLPADAHFDARFAKVLLDDNEADLTEASAARDATRDVQLRRLLDDDVIPTLRAHRDMAKSIIDDRKLEASL